MTDPDPNLATFAGVTVDTDRGESPFGWSEEQPPGTASPEAVSAMLRNPDTGPDAPYPSRNGVCCSTCGRIIRFDFVDGDRMTKTERLELARKHLRAEGWSCTPAGDFCPACKPAETSPADELRKAADSLEALVAAAHGTAWGVARTQDTHPEGDGAMHVIGVEHQIGDSDSELIFQDEEVSEEDAAYIAAMHPGMGAALVKLMRDMADWLEQLADPEDADISGGQTLAIARLINARPK